MRLTGTSIHTTIKLNEGDAVKVPSELQVLRTGSFNHPTYGKFDITTAVLAEMKANFDVNVRGVDMAFDYFHDSDKEAAAWVKDLTLKDGGNELWATVSWTPKATQKLSDREIRYFSPDFAFQWTDPETLTTFNNVLFGGGLTNRPFVKEMMAIVADEKRTGVNQMTELETLKGEIKKLSEQVATLAVPPPKAPAPLPANPDDAGDVASLKKQLADVQAQLAKAKSDNEVMMAEKTKAQADYQMAEKEKAFNILLTEGKACVAQKDAYLTGKMDEFLKLAQPVNLKGQGSSQSGDASETEVSAIMKLAEEKMGKNPKLNKVDAIVAARKELKK